MDFAKISLDFSRLVIIGSDSILLDVYLLLYHIYTRMLVFSPLMRVLKPNFMRFYRYPISIFLNSVFKMFQDKCTKFETVGDLLSVLLITNGSLSSHYYITIDI